jgi:hypothetical protein
MHNGQLQTAIVSAQIAQKQTFACAKRPMWASMRSAMIASATKGTTPV